MSKRPYRPRFTPGDPVLVSRHDGSVVTGTIVALEWQPHYLPPSVRDGRCQRIPAGWRVQVGQETWPVTEDSIRRAGK